MDDGPIDLDEARKRREAGDLSPSPPTLKVGTIVRRAYGLRDFCTHRETIVDTMARVVECRSCGADLDAYKVLGQIAMEWENLAAATTERRKLTDEIESLRAEEKRVKARLKRVKGKLPEVPGELKALREAERYLRGFASYGGAARVLAKVDAARDSVDAAPASG